MGQSTSGSGESDVSRRNVIRSSAVAAGLVGLAGCSGGGEETTEETTTEETTTTTEETTTEDTGTTTSSGGGEPLTLGFMMPLTGQYGFLGQAVEPSIRMVVDRVNEMGGIDGRPVELSIEDTMGQPDQGLVAARQQINANDVDMLIGPSSYSIMQVSDLIMEAGIPWTVACSGTTDLIPLNQECGPYRTISNDSIEGWAAAIGARFERINGVQEFTDFGVITCDTADCVSLADVHTEAFENLGGNHVGTVDITPGQSSYDSQIRRMRDNDPEIVYVMAGPPDVEKILRGSVQIGFNPHWNLPSDFSTVDFLDAIPEAARDNFFTYIDTSPGGVDEEALENYQTEYQEISGMEPGPCWNAGVDATNVMMVAAKAAAEDGDLSSSNICSQIREVASPGGEQVTTYEDAAAILEEGNEVDLFGLISDLNFDENGEVNVPFDQLVPNDAGDAYEVNGTVSAQDIADGKQGNL